MMGLKSVALYRDKNIVSSFLGSFGRDLKETRLTAALGFIIANSPRDFQALFGLRNEIVSINLEEIEENGRVDIKLRTKDDDIDLEAKVDSIDPLAQSLNYKGKRKILLSNHIPTSKQKSQTNVQYFNWDQVAKVLYKLSKENNHAIKFLSSDIINYLKNHHMIKQDKPIEIYLREINDEKTLNLFLKGQFYACNFIGNSNLYKAIYFAPHFGNSIASKHVGIQQGVSYIARIEKLEVVEDWKHFIDTMRAYRTQFWITKNQEMLNEIHKEWDWTNQRRIIFFLGKPINAFNPPIKKENLQAGYGWLSKTFLSFDDLFQARSGKIYKEK